MRPRAAAATLALVSGFAGLAFVSQGPTLHAWAVLPVLAALAAIIVLDVRVKVVPDTLTLPGIPFTVALALLLHDRTPGFVVAGILAGGGAGLLLAMVSRGGFGGGDIKLLAMLGPMLGWKDVLGTFVASQFVALFAVLVLSLARRRLSRAPVPVGAIIAGIAAILIALGAPAA